MRGEFVAVWEDTYRHVWEPLAEQEDVPEDVYSQLYRELWKALRGPAGDEAERIPLADAVQLREAFIRAIALSGTEIGSELADEAFVASFATDIENPDERRVAVENCLTQLIGNHEECARLLGVALSELTADPKRRAEAMERAVESVINDATRSKQAFEVVRAADLAGERAVCSFLEAAFDVLDDLGGDALSNRYFSLLAAFIDKFSLRYDLRRPCVLCPTLPGLFASLVRELDALSTTDQNVAKRLRDFKEAVQDLRQGQTEGRVANCVIKQVMFVESVAAASGSVKGTDLAALCKAIDHWPHPAVRQSLLSLYGFASDFPGVRHGTPSAGMKRDIDMRDMVAMSILMVGFTPYLENRLSAGAIFGGSETPTAPFAPVAALAVGSAGAADGPVRLLRRAAFWRRER